MKLIQILEAEEQEPAFLAPELYDEIARGMEQAINGVTYVEGEGGGSTRVDFGGESLWFRSRHDGNVEVEGSAPPKYKNQIIKYLRPFGAQIVNGIKWT